MVGDSLDFTDQFIQLMKKTKNNQEFLTAFQDVSFGGKITKRINKR